MTEKGCTKLYMAVQGHTSLYMGVQECSQTYCFVCSTSEPLWGAMGSPAVLSYSQLPLYGVVHLWRHPFWGERGVSQGLTFCWRLLTRGGGIAPSPRPAVLAPSLSPFAPPFPALSLLAPYDPPPFQAGASGSCSGWILPWKKENTTRKGKSSNNHTVKEIGRKRTCEQKEIFYK